MRRMSVSIGAVPVLLVLTALATSRVARWPATGRAWPLPTRKRGR
jgi:hypothetical protein